MPPVMKRSIAVYEAARVLIGYITPRYDEISQVRSLHYLGDLGELNNCADLVPPGGLLSLEVSQKPRLLHGSQHVCAEVVHRMAPVLLFVIHPVGRCQAHGKRLHHVSVGMQVSICPGGVPTGYTYFIPQEEHLESRVVTRSYMEAKMVVAMSGR